jgi:glutaminyl-tRNA synthetase
LRDATGSDAGKALAKPIATLLVNEVLGELRARKLEAVPFGGIGVVELATLLGDRTISAAQAKEVLAEMIASGKSPADVVKEKGLAQIASSDTLAPLVDAVLAENADAVARYRSGNVNVLGALVGMVMKKTGGRANAKLVSDLLKEKLGQ